MGRGMVGITKLGADDSLQVVVEPVTRKSMFLGLSDPPTDREIQQSLDDAHTFGVAVVLDDFLWGIWNPAPGKYAFQQYDHLVIEARKRGLKVVPMIWGTAGVGLGPTPPADLEAFGVAVTAFVNRYKPRGVLSREQEWHDDYGIREVMAWKEPNNIDFWTGTVEEYVDLLNMTFESVRDASPDGVVKVICGAISKNGTEISYMQSIIQLEGLFDIAAYHPWPVDHEPMNVIADIDAFRTQGLLGGIVAPGPVPPTTGGDVAPPPAGLEGELDAENPGIPLWITSFGYSVNDVAEQDAAIFYIELFTEHGIVDLLFMTRGVQVFAVYQWKENGAGFGLRATDGFARQTWLAFAKGVGETMDMEGQMEVAQNRVGLTKILHTFLFPSFQQTKQAALRPKIVDLRGVQRMEAVWKLEWDKVEPTAAGEGLWALGDLFGYDGIIDEWWTAGIDPRPIVMSTPQWSHNSGSSPGDNLRLPTNPQTMADFCVRLLQRYGRFGTRARVSEGKWIRKLMIWDEPNITMHNSSGVNAPDAAGYAGLLAAIYDTVKLYDPTVEIIHGGLAYGGPNIVLPAPWMNAIVAAGAITKFDTLGLNPFNAFNLSDIDNRLLPMRTALNAAGRTDALIFVNTGMTAPAVPQGGSQNVVNRYMSEVLKLYNTSLPVWFTKYGVRDVLIFAGPDTPDGAWGMYESQDYTGWTIPNGGSGTPPVNGQEKQPVYNGFKSGLSTDPQVVSTFPKGLHWNGFSPFTGGSGYQDTQRTRLREFAKGSVRGQRLSLRTTMRWNQLEPTNGDFTHFSGGGSGFGWDGLVLEAFQNGFEIFAHNAEFIPTFAQRASPIDGLKYADGLAGLAAIADLFLTFANRYAPGGTFVSGLGNGRYGIRHYEVENEVNLRINPQGWTGLEAVNHVSAVWNAVKAAHPDVFVYSTSLANGPHNNSPANNRVFLQAMIDAGLAYGVNTDAVILNPYSGDDLNAAESLIAEIRTVLDNNGQSAMPIIITEWGVSYNTNNPNRGSKVATIMSELFNVRAPQWFTNYKVTLIHWAGLGNEGSNGDLRIINPDGSPTVASEMFRDGFYRR
jgi:hypothetical protein